MGKGNDLAVTRDSLSKLAEDLHDMQEHLTGQVRRMDSIVDTIESHWSSPASHTYRRFHRAATEDAVHIRGILEFFEKAIRLSRDGFTEQDLAVLDQMRKVQVREDTTATVDALSTANTSQFPQRSNLSSY